MPEDLPILTPSDRAMTLDDLELAMVEAGVSPELVRKVRASRGVGKMACEGGGELEYAIGALVETIESLRSGSYMTEKLLTGDGLTVKEKVSLLDSKARLSVSLGLHVGKLIEASKLNVDRKRDRGNKVRSFAPDQVVNTAVQVTVNTQPAEPAKSE